MPEAISDSSALLRLCRNQMFGTIKRVSWNDCYHTFLDELGARRVANVCGLAQGLGDRDFDPGEVRGQGSG